MQSDERYKRVSDEIESGRQDPATWAWAMAQGGGDGEKTKAHYIRRRIVDLGEAGGAVSSGTTLPELQRLRQDIRRQLALQPRRSLYSVLGIAADSSDAEVAAAIRTLSESGAALDAETKYALEVLGNPQAREQFDRRLADQLSPPKPTITPRVADPALSGSAASGGGVKMFLMAFLVLGGAYIGLSYYKQATERELRLKEAEALKVETNRKAELAERAEAERKAAREAAEAQRERDAQARDVAQIESRMREDKRLMDQAYLEEQRQARSDQMKREAEERRRNAEAQAAVRAARQQLIQDAYARGNINEAQRLRAQQ